MTFKFSKRIVYYLIIFMLLPGVVAVSQCFAETTYVIDSPTTGMLDYGTYDLNFRLFRDGGILTRLNFGVFRIVNLGIGWEINNAIGDQNVVVSPPALYLKIRLFTGGLYLPAMVFGYDGQGYAYDRDLSKFLQSEKGVFIAFGREMLISGFELNVGGNMYDFRNNTVYGFINFVFNIEDKLILLCEYDDINYLPDSLLSAGFKINVTSDLNIDIAARDIGASGRAAERIIRVNYIGRF